MKTLILILTILSLLGCTERTPEERMLARQQAHELALAREETRQVKAMNGIVDMPIRTMTVDYYGNSQYGNWGPQGNWHYNNAAADLGVGLVAGIVLGRMSHDIWSSSHPSGWERREVDTYYDSSSGRRLSRNESKKYKNKNIKQTSSKNLKKELKRRTKISKKAKAKAKKQKSKTKNTKTPKSNQLKKKKFQNKSFNSPYAKPNNVKAKAQKSKRKPQKRRAKAKKRSVKRKR